MSNGSESRSCSHTTEVTDIAELKVDMWIAWKQCETMLIENGHMTESTSTKISPRIMQLATEMYNRIVPVFQQTEEAGIKVEEFLVPDEDICHNVSVQMSPAENHANVRKNSSEDSEWEDEPEVVNKQRDLISLAYKKRVVEMAKAHPKWSLNTLHSRGAGRLRRKSSLKTWEAEVAAGGNLFDKFKVINDMTLNRVQEARKNREKITATILQQWALKFAREVNCDSFVASSGWVRNFKRKYGIYKEKLEGMSAGVKKFLRLM